MAVEAVDHVVAGGRDDFAEVRHLRVAGTNAEIGRALARLAVERHGAITPDLRAAVVRARRRWYERNYPIHYERMAGVAEALGADFDDDRAECGALGASAGAGGCSVVYFPGTRTAEGGAFLSRNYDFTTATLAEMLERPAVPGQQPMSSRPYVIESYPDHGYPSLYVTYSYALVGGCFDGINSEGLMVSLMAIYDGPGTRFQPTHGWAVGLAEIEVLRLVLDTCATIEEAEEALLTAKQYYTVLPCHYIVGDRAGASFVFEYSESHNAEHVLPGGGEIQVATNHLLHQPDPVADPTRSGWRLQELQRWLAARSRAVTLSDMKRANARVACNPSRLPPSRSPGKHLTRTMYHAVYSAEARSLEISFYLGEDPRGGERRSPYLPFALV